MSKLIGLLSHFVWFSTCLVFFGILHNDLTMTKLNHHSIVDVKTYSHLYSVCDAYPKLA